MPSLRLALFVALLSRAVCAPSQASAAEPSAGVIQAADHAFFERKIRPVLTAHCYACHSAEAAAKGKLKAGLALDTRDGLLKGGESGPAVVPGKPAESLLLDALNYDGLEMPPSEKLSAAVVADFEKWIADGAPDPRVGAAVAVRRGMSIEDGRKFWSFIPPHSATPPKVRRADWPRDDIDRYVLAAQEKQGLAPSPEAEPRTLIRRLYFDLIGLPPEPEEVEAFLRAGSGAYERLVEELLASPHFGERWGRHWLDVARYADSNGRDRNVYNYHAWRYRDYVIDAFNRDKPFDAFIREQIAGDLLPAGSAAERDERRIATGFLALGSKAFEEQKPEVFRMDLIDEQIELVGRAVLGLSIGCARCHDHKFDPIPTADYYALAGIFRSTQPLYGYGPKGIKSNVHAHSELYAVGPDAEKLGPGGLAYLAKLQELTLVQNTARSDRYRVVRNVAAKKLELNKPGADKSRIEKEIAALEADIKAWDVKVKAAEEALQKAMDSAPSMPGWAMGVRERSAPEDCRIHVRGDVTNLADAVPRGMLQVVSVSPSLKPDAKQSGRLQLAEWLVRRDNPLTARVFVNRVWLHLFGRGLVTTPDDFGVNGARPSHPELLDHLALRFIDDGWSTKRLIRAIVLSRTYRQAGAVAGDARVSADPDDVYLSYRKPRRMEVEAFRDAIMATAGTLDRTPPKPEQAFLAKFNPYREDEYRSFQPLFTPADLKGPHRSVYLPVVRGVLPEMFQLFDFASPDRSISQRDESVVPAQSLYLMNNSWVIEQARATARRLLDDRSLADDGARVELLYRRAFGRPPTAAERERAVRYVSEPESLQTVVVSGSKTPAEPRPRPLREERWTSLCQAVSASAEFRTVP